MYINQNNFNIQRNIVNIANVRFCFLSGLYNESTNMMTLENVLTSYVDALAINNDSAYTISIKLKKTAMRKRRDFVSNDSEYYNSIIPNIMSSFLSLVEPQAIQALSARFDDPISAYRALIQSKSVLQGLIRANCIGDNIVNFLL